MVNNGNRREMSETQFHKAEVDVSEVESWKAIIFGSHSSGVTNTSYRLPPAF